MSHELLPNHSYYDTYFLYLTGNKNQISYELENPLRRVLSIEVNSALIPRSEFTIEDDRNTLQYSVTHVVNQMRPDPVIEEGPMRPDPVIEEGPMRPDPVFEDGNPHAEPELLDRIAEEEFEGNVDHIENPTESHRMEAKTVLTHKHIIVESRDYSAVDITKQLNNDDFKIVAIPGKFVFEIENKTKFPMTFYKYSSISKVLGIHKNITIKPKSKTQLERYNLMGTEVVLLESDLDSQINHGKLNRISAPLAKFYVTDSTRSHFIQNINHEQPARHFHPIGKLSKLSLQFKRGSLNRELYQFHGLYYHIHLVVRCLSYGVDWATVVNRQKPERAIVPVIHQKKEKQKPKKIEKPQNSKMLMYGLALGGAGYVAYRRRNNNVLQHI